MLSMQLLKLILVLLKRLTSQAASNRPRFSPADDSDGKIQIGILTGIGKKVVDDNFATQDRIGFVGYATR